MTGRGLSPHRATDAMVVAILYAVVFAGSYAYLRTALDERAGFLGVRSGATAALLAITPTALAVVLAVSGIRFVKEYRRKAWGYRLRARVLGAFALVAAMASAPPALFFGTLANEAVEAPSSRVVRTALGDGLDLALTYYEEKETALKYSAENDIGAVVAARGADAESVLARLSAREPSIRAVELFSNGVSVSFAGDVAARARPGSAGAATSGFLPRLSSGGNSYARYFAQDSGMTDDGQALSAIVSLRFKEKAEHAATGLSAAMGAVESHGRIADSFVAYLVFFSGCLAFPFFAIAMLFAVGATDRLLNPVAALSEAISRVGAGARRAPFLSKSGDEAGDLIEAFNAVLEGLERSRGDELRNEKIEAWRDIARKLAHELRNPLTPIRLSAERVLKRWKSSPGTIGDILDKSMVAIVQETANMESLLTEFRDFARLPEPQKDWVGLRQTIDEAVHLYSASWPSMTIDCDDIDPDLVLKADRGYLKQALGNLISNAADATGGAGRIWIRADLVKTAESRYCRIQVRDDGTGIPADIRDKVFSPYFTTKKGGTGLGLAIVEHIVTAHGGTIHFDSGEGVGTVFYIDLPAESV